MAYVVTSPCIGTKDMACTKVCPMDCFYDAGEMLVINPEPCIDCGLCQTECPVQAIFPELEVPPTEQSYIDKAVQFMQAKSAEELERLSCKP